ncbi:SPASM domain-containing protein, partial [Escherichia coli]|nr:SPASM domain-containing protein [Escherichia coli]
IERLKSYQVEFNTLTVINNVNVHYPLEVYHFLKSIGSKHMQFIELLETGTPNIDFSGHSENTFRIIDFSVPPTAYGKFMSTIFMQWVKNDVGEIFIRQFESFVSRFLGNGHTSCIFQESCKDNLVVESNGDIYECDHFVYPQYKIGNINKSELKTMNSVQLTAQKKRISAKCQQCAYKPICNGGCPKHRITKVNNETVSYFCEGYKILFSTMVPYMNAMVELAKNRVPLYHIMDVAKQMENN